MAAKSFFAGVLLKSFNYTPNKVLLNNSYRTPLVNTSVLNLRSHAAATAAVAAAAEKLKDLNIPDKPKKPMTPYLKFLETYRQSVMKQHPNLKFTEITKKCAETWNSMSDEEKQKYKEMYKSDLEKYNQIISNYKKSLTPEQREALKAAALENKTMKERTKIKKLFKETNKPKKPAVPFSIYMIEQSKIKNMSLKELMSDPNYRADWESLPETEKKRYQDLYQQNRTKYLKDLKEWEEKMIEDGHYEAVRAQTLEHSQIKLPPAVRKHLKPKRPMTPYLVYQSEQRQLRNMPFKELQTALRKEWAQMAESEKKKYRDIYEKEKKQHELDLVEWEKKMLEAGHPELVRSKMVPSDRVSRIKTLKNIKSQ